MTLEKEKCCGKCPSCAENPCPECLELASEAIVRETEEQMSLPEQQLVQELAQKGLHPLKVSQE